MAMEVDDAQKLLGKWGRWQVLFYLLISLATMFPASWHMLAIVFIGGQQEHHCKLEEGAEVNETIPYEDGELSKCSQYVDFTVNNETEYCPMGWEYGGDAGPTIVSAWDLVCEQSYLVETSQTVMVIGVMFGAMFFSAMSDRFGRKPVWLFSELAMVVIGIITAFVNNYYFFSALRFCAGALQQGIILTGFVMACELFNSDNRTFAGIAIEIFWAFGMCFLALLGFLIRNWRHLQLVISVPGAVCVAFIWLIPESVPWLAANNKVPEAEEILRKAGKINGVQMPEYLLHDPEDDRMLQENDLNAEKKKKSFIDRFKPSKKKEKEVVAHDAHRYTLLDVLKHPILRKYALIMCLLWFVNSLVYYGLSLSASALAGDRYMNFFLTGLVEAPAYASSLFILQRFGRRWPLAIFHFIAGVALVITLVIPKDPSYLPLTMTFNMIGKFGITGSFGTVFLYAPEIFPTTLRNQAMGISSVGGRLGNMLAPFSSFVVRIVPWLPGVLFGGLSIGVGLLALILPETLNRPLPETIEDIENWSKPAKKPGGDNIELANDTKNANT